MEVEHLFRPAVGVERTPTGEVVGQIVHPGRAVAVGRGGGGVDKARTALEGPLGQLARAAIVVAGEIGRIAFGGGGTRAKMKNVREIAEGRSLLLELSVKVARLDVILEGKRRKVAPFLAGPEFVDDHNAVESVPTVERPDQHAADEAGTAGYQHTVLGREVAGPRVRTGNGRFFAGRWFCFAHAITQRRRRIAPGATPRIASEGHKP